MAEEKDTEMQEENATAEATETEATATATATAGNAEVDDPKAKKFKELANKRVNDICKKILNIGKLSNKSSYHYTEEEVEKIFNVITEQVNDARAKFSATKSAPSDTKEFIHL